VLPRKQKKPNKGFHRSGKEWEESIAGHIGKAIDNGHILDYLLNAGLAYMGYNVYGPAGILMGPLALKLAQSPANAASATGVLVLGIMGLTETGILDHLYEGITSVFTAGGIISPQKVPIIGGEGGTPAFMLPKPIVPVIGGEK
jgi:hypothetical protein